MQSTRIKRHATEVLRFTHLACALPAMFLMWGLHRGELGSTPLTHLLQISGRSALVILIITLAITPLRRVSALIAAHIHLRHGKRMADWNWLVTLRRPLGLWSFSYASLHLWLYLAFDLGYDWQAGWEELWSKTYLLVGLVAWVLLVPLAATSTKRMMKRLGRHWVRLHAMVYLIAALVMLHFWMLAKHGTYAPLPDTLVLMCLLLYRATLKWGLLPRWDGDDGSASRPRRPSAH